MSRNAEFVFIAIVILLIGALLIYFSDLNDSVLKEKICTFNCFHKVVTSSLMSLLILDSLVIHVL